MRFILILLLLATPVFGQTLEEDTAAAKVKYAAGDHAGAATDFEAVIATYGSTPETEYWAGSSHFNAGAHASAIPHLLLNNQHADIFSSKRSLEMTLSSYLELVDTANVIITAKAAAKDSGFVAHPRLVRNALKAVLDNGTVADVDEVLGNLLNNFASVSNMEFFVDLILKQAGSGEELLNMALPADELITFLQQKYISLGRINDPELTTILNQLDGGGVERPLATSARMAAIGVALDDTQDAGKFWKLMLAGTPQLAAQHAWTTAKGSQPAFFKSWVDAIILARKVDQQHFSDPDALGFAAWQNNKRADNPLATWLGD